MSAIPLVQTTDRNVNQLQQNFAQAISPLLSNPLIGNGFALMKNVTVVTGNNIIPTGLNRNIQGWIVIRNRANATFYDAQDSNSQSTKTLLLVSSASSVIDIYIF